jgi:DNA-binding CsgD family transcriptional regulator/PAS domain-containing protein
MIIDGACLACNGSGHNTRCSIQPGVGMDGPQLLELIGLIYDAALDPAAWPRVLNRLVDATAAHVGENRDPFRAMWQRDPPPGVPAPEQLTPRDDDTRTDFFREWVAPQQLVAAIAANIAANMPPDDDVCAALRLHRPWRNGDLDQDKSDLFAALIPHIRPAIQLQHRLAALEMQRASLAAAFDRLRDGVITVDDQFRITFSNRSAEEILAEGDGLIQDGEGIAAATPAGTTALRRLVAAAPDGNALPRPGGRCSLARRDGRSPLAVLVIPLHAEIAWVAPRRPAAVLFITDPDRDSRASSEALRRRFRLTHAETALLAEIVKGDGIQAAANRLGVSLATARTHLRHVFDKTGTQRQAELVGLAMNSHALLCEDA